MLDKTYQGIMAAMSGKDASEITIPENDMIKQVGLQSMINNVFDKNKSALDSSKPKTSEELLAEEEGIPSDTPKADIIKMARAAADGKKLPANDIIILHALLAANGHAQDKGFSFDSELTDTERAAAGVMADRYEAGNTTLQNQGLSADNQADIAAQELKTQQQQEAATQSNLREEFGFKVVGYDGTRPENIDKFTIKYQESLQRDSVEIFGEQMNIHYIREEMANNPDVANKAISYVIKTGDYREFVADALEGNDVDKIKMAERVIGDKIDGNITSDTIKSAFNHVSEAKGLGRDNANFRFTNNDEAGAKFTNEISTNAVKAGIENGSIPLIETNDEYLNAVINDKTMPLDEKAAHIASHLTNEDNYIAYDTALKSRGIEADLTARIDAIEVKATATASNFDERKIVANNPTGVEEGSKLAETSSGTTERGTATYSDTEVAYQSVAEVIMASAGEDGQITLQEAVRAVHYTGTAEQNWTHLGWGTSEISNKESLAKRLPHRDASLPETYNVNDPVQLKQVLGATTVVSNWRDYQPAWKENGQSVTAAFEKKSPEWANAADKVAKRLTNTAAPEVEKAPKTTPDTKPEEGSTPMASKTVKDFNVAGAAVGKPDNNNNAITPMQPAVKVAALTHH